MPCGHLVIRARIIFCDRYCRTNRIHTKCGSTSLCTHKVDGEIASIKTQVGVFSCGGHDRQGERRGDRRRNVV